jgi:hypothetical protein
VTAGRAASVALLAAAALAFAGCGGDGGGNGSVDRTTTPTTTTPTTEAASGPTVTDVRIAGPTKLLVTTDWCDGAVGVLLDEKPDQVVVDVRAQGGERCAAGAAGSTTPVDLVAPLAGRPVVDASGRRWTPP